MIQNKIRNVADSICQGCTQVWEDECCAFQFPHSDDERMSRLVNNSKMNCKETAEVVPQDITVLEPCTPTEDECMVVGLLHGVGNSYGDIIEILVKQGWDRGHTIGVVEYVECLSDQIGLPG